MRKMHNFEDVRPPKAPLQNGDNIVIGGFIITAIILFIIILLFVTQVNAYDYEWAAEQDAIAERQCAGWREMKDATCVYPLPSWAPCPYSCNMGTWVYRWYQDDVVCINSGGGRGSSTSSSSSTSTPEPEDECTRRNQCCWGTQECFDLR